MGKNILNLDIYLQYASSQLQPFHETQKMFVFQITVFLLNFRAFITQIYCQSKSLKISTKLHPQDELLYIRRFFSGEMVILTFVHFSSISYISIRICHTVMKRFSLQVHIHNFHIQRIGRMKHNQLFIWFVLHQLHCLHTHLNFTFCPLSRQYIIIHNISNKKVQMQRD